MQRTLPENQRWYILPKNEWFFKQGGTFLTEKGICLGVGGMGLLYGFLEEIKSGSIDHFNEYFYLIDDHKTSQSGLLEKIQQARIKLASLKLREKAIDLAWVKMHGTGCDAKERKQLNDDQNKRLDEWIQEEWERLLENAVNDGSLTKEDVLFTELPTLFEGTEFFYKVTKFIDYPNKSNKQNNSLFAFEHLMPRSLEKHGGLVEVGSLTGAYTYSQLVRNLSALKYAIENAKPSFTHNVGFSFSNAGHAMSMHYDSHTKSWVFINANTLPAKWLTNKEAAKAILRGFSKSKHTIFQTRVFVRRDHQQAFAPIFFKWLSHPIHAITPEKANYCDTKGLNWLYIAIKKGDLVRARELIKISDVNNSNINGDTPLHIAARQGHLDIVKELIAAGANVNKCNNGGMTPLHIAAQYGQLDVLNELLPFVDNVNLTNSLGYSALHIAVSLGKYNIVEALTKLEKVDLDASEASGLTPLITAVTQGNLSMVDRLIATGARVNKPDKNQLTPLYIAADTGNLSMVKRLIAAGADVNIPNINGSTTIFVAAQNGHVDVVEALLATKKVNVNLANKNWVSPLYVAAQKGYLEIVIKLIAAGADVNQENQNKLTPIYIATRNNHLEVVKKLLAAGASLIVTDKHGKSLLSVVKTKGYEEIRLILKKSYKLEYKNKLIEKTNLAVKGNNTKEDRAEANDDNYLGWVKSHASFFNLSHNKTGDKRAKILLIKINRDDASLKEVKEAINNAYENSPNHQHSLSRFLMRYIKTTDQSIHDLSEAEFFEYRKKYQHIV